jgi:ribosome-binding protein aMBF1 (putative translation factor)
LVFTNFAENGEIRLRFEKTQSKTLLFRSTCTNFALCKPKQTIIMLFSERIRTLRKEQGVLQRRLAEAIGVDVPMYSRYEHGERHPKREQVVKLARLLGTDAGELVALWLAEEAMNAIASWFSCPRT